MTTRKYSSRSQQTTLTSAVTSGATIIPVANAATLLGGATVSTGQTFTVVIDPDTALEEIVEVTVVSSNNLTVTRAVDMAGSAAQDHSAGAVIRHMIIGRDLRESNLHIEATGSYNDGTAAHDLHGLGSSDGVVVGTDKTQTLTNKTLASPTITGTPGVDTSIVFEGATADAYETTLTVVDPTADRTITLPNATGTVVLKDTTDTLTNKTLTSPTISGSPVITGLSSAGMSASSAAPKDYVDAVLVLQTAQATAAATSAASAATSATAAATSATSAAASATAAATSATSAANSVSSISGYATTASNSASAAATSASSAATSATSAATSASSAATTYTAYDVRYLGSKASAPTLDNQGGALITGATYWNSVANVMYAWSGSAWSAVSTANGAVTTGTLAQFAATTSAQLAGVVSDETGTGALVFANTPTLVTPVLGVATATSVNGTTVPTSKTLVVTTDKLSVHAATTSAELAGVISDETGSGSLVFATSPTFVTPILGTPASGTLTNATGLPIAGLVASTSTALGVGSIELGHATDTTISRASAGVVNIEGVPVVTTTATQTLTNKTLTAPIISTISNTGTITLPTSTDTLVGKATTDTLTNKTLTSPVITTPKVAIGYTAKTAAYTVASGDEGYLFSMNNAATQQFNIPTDATFNFAIGTEIHFVWITGAGQPTIGATTPATTTILSTGATAVTPKLRVVNSAATAIKLAANSWLVVGDLA